MEDGCKPSSHNFMINEEVLFPNDVSRVSHLINTGMYAWRHNLKPFLLSCGHQNYKNSLVLEEVEICVVLEGNFREIYGEGVVLGKCGGTKFGGSSGSVRDKLFATPSCVEFQNFSRKWLIFIHGFASFPSVLWRSTVPLSVCVNDALFGCEVGLRSVKVNNNAFRWVEGALVFLAPVQDNLDIVGISTS
ncbi:hypothetical protein RJT34_22904 [Clitoria ternatea]|uniref:Uncharacterized protein n=1 Tax=Clitoria ternatea TaxID=43366 RepID=A0AAN9IHW7_CLITE